MLVVPAVFGCNMRSIALFFKLHLLSSLNNIVMVSIPHPEYVKVAHFSPFICGVHVFRIFYNWFYCNAYVSVMVIVQNGYWYNG
jgi:hypothetical protein